MADWQMDDYAAFDLAANMRSYCLRESSTCLYYTGNTRFATGQPGLGPGLVVAVHEIDGRENRTLIACLEA
jgi:hypothetical protein